MRRKHLFLADICVAFLAVFALLVLLHLQPEVLYHVTFLPALGGTVPVAPQAINDRGQVVGIAEVAKSQWHIFFWDEDQGMLDMGPWAYDPVQINNAGQIAGVTVDPNGDPQAFLRDPNGVRHVLPAPSGRHIHVQGLNNRGQVAGYHDANRSPRRAFVWDRASGMQELAPPNTLESIGRGINDAGQVVGYLSVDRTNDRYAFLWDPNTGMRNLGPVRSLPAATCHINNQGLVVGQFGSAKDQTCLSIWTSEGGARRVDSHGAAMYVAAVNDAGRFLAHAYWSGRKVLGHNSPERSTSYLWDPNDGLTEIHCHLGRKDVAEFVAVDMNNNGQILGLLTLENRSDPIGVVLEPIK